MMVPEAARAATQLVWVVGYAQSRHAEGRHWGKNALPLARAAGSTKAEMMNSSNLGVVAYAESR